MQSDNPIFLLPIFYFFGSKKKLSFCFFKNCAKNIWIRSFKDFKISELWSHEEGALSPLSPSFMHPTTHIFCRLPQILLFSDFWCKRKKNAIKQDTIQLRQREREKESDKHSHFLKIAWNKRFSIVSLFFEVPSSARLCPLSCRLSFHLNFSIKIKCKIFSFSFVLLFFIDTSLLKVIFFEEYTFYVLLFLSEGRVE